MQRHKEQNLTSELSERNSSLSYPCDKCKGTRVILAPDAEGVKFIDCECVTKDSWEYRLSLSNVPQKYRQFEISQLSKTFLSENADYLKLVHDYIHHLPRMIEKGHGLFFQSDPGLAKSSIAAVIVRHALKLGYRCYMGRMSKFMSLKFDALRDPDAKETIERLVKDTDLIVVEEIEKTYLTGDMDRMTEILVSEFFGELYDNRKSIIVTSNLPRNALGKLPQHILDRFNEVITDIIFVGESYRAK